MKHIIALLLCVASSLVALAQAIGNPGGFQYIDLANARPYNICPVNDNEVEINGIGGGTQDVVPYDFYASLNCPVTHTLDSVFYVYSDTIVLDVACSSPCYVIIYGMEYGQESGFHFIPVITHSNGKYRINTRLGDLCEGLNRIIVTKGNQVLKKTVYGQSSTPQPANSIISEFSGTNEINSSNAILDTQHSCTVAVTNTWDNTTTTLSGEIANNMYFLYGNVALSYGTTFHDAQLPHEPYSIFTTQSTTDVDMFLINSDNEIIGHNNNYSGESSHEWGTEARIDMSGNDSLKAVILVPYRSYIEHYDNYWGVGDIPWTADDTPDGKADLYLGCKLYNIYSNDNHTYFPELLQNDALKSDPSRTFGLAIDYNCFAWAVGYYSYYFHHNYNSVTTVNGLMYYYEVEGYTSDGATEENSEIDIWENNGVCTHASIRSNTNGRSFGYAWESKDGMSGPRLMHPRYALTHDTQEPYAGYGHVAAYMIKNPEYENIEMVYENIDFSDEELNALAYNASSIAPEIVLDFERSYVFLEADFNKTHISNPALLKYGLETYKDMLEKCKTSSEYLQMMMYKLSEGSIIATYILLDIKDVDEHLSKETDVLNAPIAKVGVDDQKIVRPDLSEAILFAKSLLNEKELTKKELIRHINYSNDENVLFVRPNNRYVDIDVSLAHDSNVSIIISKHDGSLSKLVVNQEVLQAGHYCFGSGQLERGLYTVTLLVNGHVYVKKISVK